MGQTDSAFIIYEMLHQEIKEKKIIPADHKINMISKSGEKPNGILHLMFSENNGMKTFLSVVLIRYHLECCSQFQPSQCTNWNTARGLLGWSGECSVYLVCFTRACPAE